MGRPPTDRLFPIEFLLSGASFVHVKHLLPTINDQHTASDLAVDGLSLLITRFETKLFVSKRSQTMYIRVNYQNWIYLDLQLRLMFVYTLNFVFC